MFVFLFLLFAQPINAAMLDNKLPPYKTTNEISGNIKSIGSDTLNNLMTFWAEGFRQIYPNVKIEIEGKGSSTAPPALIVGTSSFGPMSRAMKSKETDTFEKKFGYKPFRIRIAIDALAIFVNKDNPLKCISMPHIDAIFSKTRKGGIKNNIQSWGKLGLKGLWKDKPISIYGRNSASGTYGYFKKVALYKGDYKNSVKEQPGSSAVIQGIASDKFSIGYSGIGYNTADVRALSISRKTGEQCIPPNIETTYTGNYPFARFLYIYTNKKPHQPFDPLRLQFIKYILSKNGQLSVIKAGFFPINAAIANHTLRGMGF